MNSTPSSILVAGSANLDFVVRAAHVPAPGETVLGRDFANFPGGKGANQAVAAARAGGAATQMLLGLGEDDAARVLEGSLEAAGVRMHIVRAAGVATGVAFVCLSDSAENAITVAPGANAALKAEHLPSLSGISHLLMQLETPIETITAYARAARAAGVKVVLNAAPAQALPGELLDAVDVLIVNEGELAAIAGAGRVGDLLARLKVPTVVVTLGSRGCCARVEGSGYRLQPSFPIEALDTTAAGDTFSGVFVAALSQGAELSAALRRASAAAAIACTRLGAQSSIPSVAEVDAFLAERPSGTSDIEALTELATWCGLASP
ncbi:ribokinase [Pelomonas sp. KK5]|uniref:ribokinase n=1 Tax=Pelomonas sp. KK5 TaxID=1855730 RepID=UPI00097BB311|nr:ribokinase [Pelomonas sp. KK5]